MGLENWLKGFSKRLWSVLKLHRTVPLLWHLLLDGQVPLVRKVLFLGLGIAYTALPLDLVMDWIPFLGQLDDLTVWLLLAENFISGIQPHIRGKYLKPKV